MPGRVGTGSPAEVAQSALKLHVQDFVQGSPIVFLHGGLRHVDNSFARQRDEFEASQTLVWLTPEKATEQASGGADWCDRQESNLRLSLRRAQ